MDRTSQKKSKIEARFNPSVNIFFCSLHFISGTHVYTSKVGGSRWGTLSTLKIQRHHDTIYLTVPCIEKFIVLHAEHWDAKLKFIFETWGKKNTRALTVLFSQYINIMCINHFRLFFKFFFLFHYCTNFILNHATKNDFAKKNLYSKLKTNKFFEIINQYLKNG